MQQHQTDKPCALVRYHINEWALAWVRALAYPWLAVTCLEARAVEMEEEDMDGITGEAPVRGWLSRDLTNDLRECVCCHKRFKKGDDVVAEIIATITSEGPEISGPTVPYHRHCVGLWPQILRTLMDAPDQDTFKYLASKLLSQSAPFSGDDVD